MEKQGVSEEADKAVLRRKFLFLDIDGVMRPGWMAHMEIGSSDPRGWSGDARVLLGVLLERSGAAVVVSSAVRKLPGRTPEWFEREMSAAGLNARVAGVTPGLGSGFRGDEVSAWLESRGEDDAEWVALDDNSDFHGWQPLVQTRFHAGLTLAETLLALELLNPGDSLVEQMARHPVYGRLLGRGLGRLSDRDAADLPSGL